VLAETETSLVPSHLFFDKPGEIKTGCVNVDKSSCTVRRELCWRFPEQIYVQYPGSGLEAIAKSELYSMGFTPLIFIAQKHAQQRYSLEEERHFIY